MKIQVILLVAQFATTVIFSQIEISHVLNGPRAKNQYRCGGPYCVVDSAKHAILGT